MTARTGGARKAGRVEGEGFSLVEVVMALGLVTFVLVAIIGLFSVGLSGARESGQAIDAANLATEILGKRLAAPTNALPSLSDGSAFALPAAPAALPSSPEWSSAPIYAGPGGYVVASNAAGACRLTYAYWKNTNGAASAASAPVRLSIILSSPAGASLDKASSRYEVTTSYFAQ